MKKEYVKWWTDKEFKNKLKALAAIEGKSLRSYTSELARKEDLDEWVSKFKKKKNETFRF